LITFGLTHRDTCRLLVDDCRADYVSHDLEIGLGVDAACKGLELLAGRTCG
jgi:hypothetical protein